MGEWSSGWAQAMFRNAITEPKGEGKRRRKKAWRKRKRNAAKQERTMNILLDRTKKLWDLMEDEQYGSALLLVQRINDSLNGAPIDDVVRGLRACRAALLHYLNTGQDDDEDADRMVVHLQRVLTLLKEL